MAEPPLETLRQEPVAPAPAFVAPVAEPSREAVRRDAESFAREVEDSRDSFVAPAPVMVEAPRQPLMAPTRAAAPTSQPDPFREAELTNATRRAEPAPAEPTRSRGPSLISKVTGLGRLLGGGQPAERRAEPRAEPTVAPATPPRTASRAADALRTPAPRAAAPAPARPAPAQPAPEPRAAQPRLNLDPADRRTTGGGVADEHLLDIPAFLRRQAN